MDFGDAPLEDRLKLFTSRDMAIFHEGVALPGFKSEIGPATRPGRDEITGEEFPTPDDEAVLVISTTIVYPFRGKPESLALNAPSVTGMANIGFVLYHLGVAVNEFRYLSSGNAVRLDWDDPWYSSFQRRALRRQY